jgi:FkbM family methyltransferase
MYSKAKAFLKTRFPGVYAKAASAKAQIQPERELRLIRYLSDEGKTSVDVGANIGIYTKILLRHSKSVIAFEPNPALAPALRSRFSGAISKGSLTFVPKALGSTVKSSSLFVPCVSSGLASLNAHLPSSKLKETRKIAVDETTLDSFNLNSVGFIKIDVEGHEIATVTGALETIERCKPTLLIECEERAHTIPRPLQRLSELLTPLHYEGFFLDDNGKLRSISEFNPKLQQSEASLNPTGTSIRPGHTYVNNFVFLRRDSISFCKLLEADIMA